MPCFEHLVLFPSITSHCMTAFCTLHREQHFVYSFQVVWNDFVLPFSSEVLMLRYNITSRDHIFCRFRSSKSLVFVVYDM